MWMCGEKRGSEIAGGARVFMKDKQRGPERELAIKQDKHDYSNGDSGAPCASVSGERWRERMRE